jgi:hypothetical protein
MARISAIENEAASPEVREIYEITLRGKPNGLQKLLAHRPELLKNFIPFYASIGRSLRRRIYELVHPCLHDQRLPLLPSASSRQLETGRHQPSRVGET